MSRRSCVAVCDAGETDTSPSSRYIPAAVKRAVHDRDGKQCTFVDANGRRCTERDGLEFHHRDPYGRGGDHRPENLYLMCPTHNAYLAEHVYGKEVMEKYRRSGSCAREPAPVYLISSRAVYNGARLLGAKARGAL